MSRNIPSIINRPPFQPPRPTPVNRTLIQDKVVDSSVIGKLFLLCIEGKVSAIKDFIIQNGLTVNDMVDSTGDNILHKILQNENLSKRDKIELFRFLKEKNLLKMSFNSQQLTPLHLAVRTQIPEIVKILLEAGHSPNDLDVNNKTPLFYAIAGQQQECPKKEEKGLLQKTKFKLENSDIYLLVNELIKVINDNNNTSIYNMLQHISNTCQNLDSIFSKDIISIFEKDNKKIIDILTSNDTDDVKRNKIMAIVYETKMSIAKLLIKNKFEPSLKPFTFQPNSIGGWGPDANPKNKVLKIGNISEIERNLTTDINLKLDKTSKQLNTNLQNLDKTIKHIYALYAGNIDELLNQFNAQYQFLKHLITIPRGGSFEAVVRDPTQFPDVTDPSIINLLTNNNVNEEFISRNIDNNNNINLNNDNVNELNELRIPRYTSIPRDPRDIIRRSLADINRNNAIVGTGSTFRPVPINGKPIVAPGDRSKFFTRKLKMIYQQVLINLQEITASIVDINQELNNNFKNINYDIIYNECIKTQVKLLNIINHLPFLQEEINNIMPKIGIFNQGIVNFTQHMTGSIIEGATNQYTTDDYFRNIEITLDELQKDYSSDKIKQEFDDTYVMIRELYNSLNNTINVINESCGIKYINLYFNNFTDYDNFFTTTNTESIDKIYDIQLSSLNQIPAKYEDMIKLFTSNLVTNKILLVEQFMHQVYSTSYTSYYDNTKPQRLPTIGYLYDNIDNVLLATQPTIPKLLYGPNSFDTTIINNSPVNLKGSNGNYTPIQKNKKESVLSIIGNSVNEHIKILKYYIIRKLLDESYKLLIDINKNPTTIPANRKDYAEIIKRIYDNTRTTLQLDSNDMSVILMIIGSSIDKLLNTNIENSILTGINRFAYKTNRKPELDAILDVIKTRKTRDPKAVLGTDTFDIEHFMKDTKFLVQDLKDIVKKLVKGSREEYVFTFAEDIFSKIGTTKTNKEDTKNLKKKYSKSIIDNDPPTCYSVNHDIIDLLLTHRANVSIRDKEGSTIIFSAIDLNDPELVSKIINLVPVFNKHSKNILGTSPYEHVSKQVKYFTSMFLDKSVIEDLIESSHEMISKKTQIQAKMRYHSEIYHMLYILMNHYIYSMGKQYINGWNKDNQKLLAEQLNIKEDDFPLLTVIENINQTDTQKYLTSVMDQTIKDKSELQIKLLKIQEQIVHLQTEKSEAGTSDLRKKIIDDIVAKLQAEIAKPEYASLVVDKIQSENVKYRITIELRQGIKDIRANMDKLVASSELINMYESIQTNIINTANRPFENDYKTYMLIWQEAIKNNSMNSVKIIENISEYLMKNNTLSSYPIISLTLIQNYFDKIVAKLATDYNELEYVYNGDNYVLNSIINIVKHILSHTVGINLLNIIQQLIREEIRMKTPYDTKTYPTELYYNDIIDSKLKDVLLASKVKGTKLNEYILEELIEKLIKNNFDLYEDSYEKENMKDSNSLFLEINKLLEANGIINLDEKSLVMKELREKIYPYFKEYIETNLKQIKKYVDGYMNSLANYSNIVSIYTMIMTKAQTEK
jgi:hypothetical protein